MERVHLRTDRSCMFHDIHSLEVMAREKQEDLRAQGREAAAAVKARNAPGRRSPFAPLLETLGQLLIDAGESLRRSAYP